MMADDSLFYAADLDASLIALDEEESRHLAGVLRRKAGDTLQLCDGQGRSCLAEIVEVGKRALFARALHPIPAPAPNPALLRLAVAPTKHADRIEWLVEKAVEIGVRRITPLLCERSERRVLRTDRLQKIALSAMKQSKRLWLPRIDELTPFPVFLKNENDVAQRFIAECGPAPKPHLFGALERGALCCVLIGPEGDFSPAEVALALEHGYGAVSLGAARLRTETAALSAVMIAAMSR